MVASLIVAAACGSPGGVELRYDLARGDALTYDVVQEIDGTLATAQATTPMQLTITTRLVIEVVGEDGDEMTLSMRSERSMASSGGRDVPIATPPTYETVLDGDTGEILRVEIDGPMGSSPSMLTFLPQLPARRVTTGDEWTLRRDLTVGGAPLELLERSTLRQAESDGPVVVTREIELPIVADLPLQQFLQADLGATAGLADATVQVRGAVRMRTEDVFDREGPQWMRSTGMGDFNQVAHVVGTAVEIEDALQEILGEMRLSGTIRTSVTAVDPPAGTGP